MLWLINDTCFKLRKELICLNFWKSIGRKVSFFWRGISIIEPTAEDIHQKLWHHRIQKWSINKQKSHQNQNENGETDNWHLDHFYQTYILHIHSWWTESAILTFRMCHGASINKQWLPDKKSLELWFETAENRPVFPIRKEAWILKWVYQRLHCIISSTLHALSSTLTWYASSNAIVLSLTYSYAFTCLFKGKGSAYVICKKVCSFAIWLFFRLLIFLNLIFT